MCSFCAASIASKPPNYRPLITGKCPHVVVPQFPNVDNDQGGDACCTICGSEGFHSRYGVAQSLAVCSYICRYDHVLLASALQSTSLDPIRNAWRLFLLDDQKHVSVKQTTKPCDRHMFVSCQPHGGGFMGGPWRSEAQLPILRRIFRGHMYKDKGYRKTRMSQEKALVHF